jgi:transcriptional regulator with XRE-family HTH domain
MDTVFSGGIPEMAGKRKEREKPRSKRKKPSRLASKLLLIREQLGLSQAGLIRRLGLESQIERDYISKFERGILEPTLEVLLAYARAISTNSRGEFLEAIIDDEIDLPQTMPADPGRYAIPRMKSRRARSSNQA